VPGEAQKKKTASLASFRFDGRSQGRRYPWMHDSSVCGDPQMACCQAAFSPTRQKTCKFRTV